jgi:mRNA-degrading endonuclease RelE of RelBE toxin-antitoxin system
VTALRGEAWTGEPLLRELDGLWKYKVRRFRIVYEIDRKKRMIKSFAIVTEERLTKSCLNNSGHLGNDGNRR